MMTRRIGAWLLVYYALLCGCSSQVGDGSTTQRVRDGAPESDGEPNVQSVCTLRADSTCSSSEAGVLCCPQKGRPYDFANACYENATETVYCYEDRSGLPLCGSAAGLGCAASPDGTKAWFMVGGLWRGKEKEGYVTCDEAGLSIYKNGGSANPDCP